MTVKLLENTFHAWIDRMPGSQPKLVVEGQAEVPTGGWKGTITPAIPQGINPQILILDVHLTRPTGIVTQVISRITLRYEESPPKADYTEVTIRYERQSFTIKVGHTS